MPAIAVHWCCDAMEQSGLIPRVCRWAYFAAPGIRSGTSPSIPPTSSSYTLTASQKRKTRKAISYEEERLVGYLRGHAERDAIAIADSILRDVVRFCRAAPQQDDMTLLVLWRRCWRQAVTTSVLDCFPECSSANLRSRPAVNRDHGLIVGGRSRAAVVRYCLYQSGTCL